MLLTELAMKIMSVKGIALREASEGYGMRILHLP